MPKRALKFGFKALLFKLKVLGAFGFLAAFLFAGFAWRVSSSPWDVSFAKDYITAALRDDVTGNYAVMERVTLFWPAFKGPLYLEFGNAQLMNKAGVMIVSVERAAISFSRGGLLRGRVMPKSIILKGPSLRFIREVDDRVHLDMGLQPDEEEEINQEQIGLSTRIFNFIARPGVQSDSTSLISRLEVFAIEDARVLVDDKAVQQTWSFPDFDLKLYSTRKGLKGAIDMVMPDVGLESSGVHLDMDYVWGEKGVILAADLNSIDLKTLAEKVPELGVLASQNIVFDAHVETLLDENFSPDDLRVQITSKTGEIVHETLSDAPIPYADLSLNATYNYAGKALQLSDTAVTLRGVHVQAEAEVTHSMQEVKGPVKIWIEEAAHDQVVALWPKFLEGDASEKWIVKKMSGGRFKDVSVAMDLKGVKQEEWGFSVQNVMAAFSAEDINLDYKAPLDVARGLYGSGQFDVNADILSLDISKGKIGHMDAFDSKLVFYEVAAKGQGHADLLIGLRGQISDLLRYIAKEPIGLNDIGLAADQVEGNANLRVGLKFPTRKDVKKDEFKVEIDGTLEDILFPDVVRTLDLSGGPLAFKVHQGKVRLEGKALLEKREAELAYETFLDSSDQPYKEKISVKIMVDPNIRAMMGIDLSDFIEGSVFADVVYATYRGGTAKADIRADLAPSVFFVKPFDFAKPSGEKADAQMSVYFKDKNVTQIKNLQGRGALFEFSDAALQFRNKDGEVDLVSGAFPAFTLDQTKGALDFVYDERGALNIDIQAAVLDAQPFMAPSDKGSDDDVDVPYQSPPMKISMRADKLITAPEGGLSKAVLAIDIDDQGRFTQWIFDAIAGTGTVSGRYQSDDKGRRTFGLIAEDAGAFLKALDIFGTMIGGRLEINGIPMSGVNDRNLKGKAKIRDFRIIKAPALTKILSVLSLTGIGDALSDKGLKFDKLEAKFDWIYGALGSVLKLRDGRTSGNSIGLLFDGSYDGGKRFVDISGTIVPMSGLNKVIGKIPLVGDILTGGSGGIFAATYKIEGSSDDLKVSANPLSVLTPGILRRVLWE